MSNRENSSRRETEIAVIGGGLVGGALAYGLARQGHEVTVFDEGDQAFRASRGNFGLVWVQTKGGNEPAYARWSWKSSDLWKGFAAELSRETGTDLQLVQDGGLIFCETEEELQQQSDLLAHIRTQLGGDYPYEMLGNNQLRKLMPEAGPKVPGASWCPMDGHVNPLKLMMALHRGFSQLGGRLENGAPVRSVVMKDGGFEIDHGGRIWQAGKLVLAAGLGNKHLSVPLGLNAPVEPNRGQVLITERLEKFMDYPTVHVRQTAEGTIQIGDSKEDVGLNAGTSLDVYGKIARRAVTFFPKLEHARLIRAWGALRVMSPDGLPIYQESESCPGAYLVTCHSGVTLAAMHAGPVANWITGQTAAADMAAFSGNRFNV